MGCIDGGFAQCVGGTFVNLGCGATLQCFALPLVNSAGTSIACTTEADAAARIGLIPPIPRGRVRAVGNAAIEGASLALLSAAGRCELETLVQRVEHCRLETHPRFFDFFVDGCLFQPVETA